VASLVSDPHLAYRRLWEQTEALLQLVLEPDHKRPYIETHHPARKINKLNALESIIQTLACGVNHQIIIQWKNMANNRVEKVVASVASFKIKENASSGVEVFT